MWNIINCTNNNYCFKKKNRNRNTHITNNSFSMANPVYNTEQNVNNTELYYEVDVIHDTSLYQDINPKYNAEYIDVLESNA